VDRACKQVLEQVAIQSAEFLAEPVAGGYGLLHIKAVKLGGIKDEVKAEFDHEQRMFNQKSTQLGGVNKAPANTQ
jgi:hypothetical protein